VSANDKAYAMWIHLGALLASFTGTGILPLVVALVMWLVKKQDSAFIDDHGREAVNFQISLFLLLVIGLVVIGILGFVTCGIGWALLAVWGLAIVGLGIVGTILAAMAANRGEYFRYPACIRLVG
jgi:uncharacterized Tic20 family protein